MILDIIAEVIGKSIEDNFKRNRKIGWIIVGFVLVILLILILTR